MSFLDDLNQNYPALRDLLREWVVNLIHENRPMWRDDGVDLTRADIINILGAITRDGNTVTIGTLTAAVDADTLDSLHGASYVTKALFDAQTVLAATVNDTPAALTLAEQTVVGRLTGGNVAAVSIGIADNNILQVDQADAADNEFARFTAAGLESLSTAEVLSALGLDAHVRKHNLDGTNDHTGLGGATEDNFMGINAGGLPVDSGSCADDFAAAVHAHTTYVLKSLFTAQTVIAATASATPAAVTMAEQTVVGRLTGGNIAAVSLGIADNNVVQIDQADAADNDYAKFTAAGLEGRSCTEVKQDLDLEDADINTLADAVADGLIAAAFTETSGPTALTLGSITNGQHLQRVNTEIVGSTLSGIYVAKSIVDTKGDLIVAEADNDVGVLAAGANGTVLTADDGEATGLKWAAAGGGVSEISLGTYPGGMSYTP